MERDCEVGPSLMGWVKWEEEEEEGSSRWGFKGGFSVGFCRIIQVLQQ